MSIHQGQSSRNSELNFSKLSIAQIKSLSQEWSLDSSHWELLGKDNRTGVKKLVNIAVKRREQAKTERIRQDKCLRYERKFWDAGLNFVAGVDEVGRGCLAGPVVAAAVILPMEFFLPGLDDSKKLSESKRIELDKAIREQAISFSCFQVEAKTIDSINILQASLEAMRNALKALKTIPQQVLVDGHIKPRSLFPELPIVDGDSRSLSIAAASVVAKVYRDKRMCDLDLKYPGYGFSKNKGYGSPLHLIALNEKGLTPEHRKSYSPVKSILKKSKNLHEIFLDKINSCKDSVQLDQIGQDIKSCKSKFNTKQLGRLRVLFKKKIDFLGAKKQV